MRRLISSGSPFEAGIGYSRAVVDGEWIFVSGTTGFDYDAMTISSDVREQAEQTMRNIGQALSEAGSSFTIDFGLVRLLSAPSRKDVRSETGRGAIPPQAIDRPAPCRSVATTSSNSPPAAAPDGKWRTRRSTP